MLTWMSLVYFISIHSLRSFITHSWCGYTFDVSSLTFSQCNNSQVVYVQVFSCTIRLKPYSFKQCITDVIIIFHKNNLYVTTISDLFLCKKIACVIRRYWTQNNKIHWKLNHKCQSLLKFKRKHRQYVDIK